MNNKKKKALLVVIMLPIIGAILAILLKTNALISLLLIYILPASFLTAKDPKHFLKAFVFAFLMAVPLIIIIDFISGYSKTWIVNESIFSIRILEYVKIEVILWAFFQVYFIIIFYEFFLDKKTRRDKWLLPRLLYLAFSVIVIFTTFLIIYYISKPLLDIYYFYLLVGLILIFLPTLLFLLKYQDLAKRFLFAAIYFFFHAFLVEYTGLTLKTWSFTGENYLGWIQLNGIAFPFEEFFFWMVLFSTATLSFYEFFADDRK